MGFPTNTEETLTAVLEAYAEQPDDLYWGRRLLEVCHDQSSVAKHRAHIARAFANWASYDPAWFVHAIGFLQDIQCIYWPKDLLEEIETLVTLENGSVKHFVLGRLWWAAKLRRQEDPEFAKRAVDHFLQVEEPYRFGNYHVELAEALAVVHPEQLEARADILLARVPGYSLADVRHTLLEAAARTENWDAYDRHRATYREMQEYRQTELHTDCEVLNLDGLVALARGRSGQIPDIFRELLARGLNVPFLGTPDTLRLVTALLRRKKHLVHCRDYLRMIQMREPSDGVAKVLADVEAAMSPRRTKTKQKKKNTRVPKKKGSRARPSVSRRSR